MKYGARAIVWGHKIMGGRASVDQVPSKIATSVATYLADKGYSPKVKETSSKAKVKPSPEISPEENLDEQSESSDE